MRCQGMMHFRGIVVVALLMLMLQGCASLYLHSDIAETATQAAKDELTKINIDKTFADAKMRLDTFAVEEDSGVAAYLVAARNSEIASLVRKNVLDDSGEAPSTVLSNLVLMRAQAILGRPTSVPSMAVRLADTRIAMLPTSRDLINENAEVNRRFYQRALREFGAAGGDAKTHPVDCDKTSLSTAQLAISIADIAYIRVVEACIELKKATNDLTQARLILAPEAGSQLKRAIDEANTAASTINAQQVEAGRIEAAIKKLQVAPPSDAKDLAAQIEQIRELLSRAQGIAAATGAEQISKALEDILAADLSAKPSAKAPSPSSLTKGTLALLKLTTALAEAGDAYSAQSQVMRVNSTLLAIAEQRQRLDMAKLTMDQQRTILQIYAAQELALVRELALLSTTQRIVDKTLRNAKLDDGFAGVPTGNNPVREGTGAALAAYVESWNQGRIPYRVLEFREIQVERAYIVQRASKTAKNWVAVLSPPLDDLVAHGRGGIHPEAIATIITNLGIVGAVLAR